MILAGGQSSRMGTDKALLSPNGKPMITVSVEVAASLTDHVFVVTPWPERYRTLVPSGCKFIQEQDRPSQGPLAGFVQGCQQVQTEWVLALACDLPFLRSEVLQEALKSLPIASTSTMALLPWNEQRWEPLCGFYRHHCLLSMQEYLAQGGRSFQQWLKTQVVAELPLTDRKILFNCNTKTDLFQLTTKQPPAPN